MSKKYVANIPPGTHLASSKNTYGAKRGTLLDDYTNEIVGQAEFIEEDDDQYNSDEDYDDSEDISFGEVLGGIIGSGLAIGAVALFAKCISNSHDQDDDEYEDDEETIIENEKKRIRREIELEEYRQKELKKAEMKKKAKNIIKLCCIGCCKGIWWIIKHIAIALWFATKYISIALWWGTTKSFIVLKRFTIWSYKKVKQSIENKRQKTFKIMNTNKNCTEFNANININPEQFSENIDKAFSDFQKNMSSEEAQLHFIKILLLSNELAKEIREFSNASINNEFKSRIDYSAWQNAMGKLMTEKTSRYINYILESNGKNIDLNLQKSLAKGFNVKLWNSDEFVPICQEQINEALKIK